METIISHYITNKKATSKGQATRICAFLFVFISIISFWNVAPNSAIAEEPPRSLDQYDIQPYISTNGIGAVRNEVRGADGNVIQLRWGDAWIDWDDNDLIMN